MRSIVAAALFVVCAAPAGAQVFNLVNLDRLNRRLAGRVGRLHPQPRRRPPDLLADPGHARATSTSTCRRATTPRTAVPADPLLATWPTSTSTRLLGSDRIVELDRMIDSRRRSRRWSSRCPDGTYSGENRFRLAPLAVRQRLRRPVRGPYPAGSAAVPARSYSIRPEREAHALLGASAGGFGAMSLAIKPPRPLRRGGHARRAAQPALLQPATATTARTSTRRPTAGATATTRTRSSASSTSACSRLRAREVHRPGLRLRRRRRPPDRRDNPADLLFTTDLRPGELAIYVNYPGRDNWNFDAQAESFAWLAAAEGSPSTSSATPRPATTSATSAANHAPSRWLGRHLLPAHRPRPLLPDSRTNAHTEPARVSTFGGA